MIGEGESAVMVPLLIDSGRTVRANVSFDAALLDAIDAAAKERGLTRSAFLASAARGKIMAGARERPGREKKPPLGRRQRGRSHAIPSRRVQPRQSRNLRAGRAVQFDTVLGCASRRGRY